jgi:hypothetical protein
MMLNPLTDTAARQQRGSVLFVVLIIMVMVMLMGISSMRAAVFSSKVSTGVQSDAMSFEAAETGIFVTFHDLQGMNGEQLMSAIDGTGSAYCIKDGTRKGAECGTSDYLDERELLTAGAYVRQNGYRPIPGELISTSGGLPTSPYVFYQIDILGTSAMPSYNTESFHLQETLKPGPKVD